MDRDRASEVRARTAPFTDALAADALDIMTLTMSVALQPRLDVDASLGLLDRLAADCPTPTRDGVLAYLCGPQMFTGDRRDYHRWQNSCLDHVLRGRRGIPITLAVVAIEVARRVDVELVGVAMPGHFLVGDPVDPEWFADPFSGRVGLGRNDCRDILAEMGANRWLERFLDPVPSRLVIMRMLNNLKLSCDRRGDVVRLSIVMWLRQALVEFTSEHDEAVAALAVLN